ncbi:MAG: glycoside hydrolase family 5 protein [Deltaproteobacteria bacterium]|nr:glycoside hydrolase family 5 protein [Deltaproteobacteria bacterium]
MVREGFGPGPDAPGDYLGAAAEHGALQVIGTQLCDESGTPIQLKGVSTHGIQWFPTYPKHTVYHLAYDWGIDVIRPAMYVEDYKDDAYWAGYIAEPEYMTNKLTEIIDEALDLDIYVLVDWHIHNNPNNFTTQAVRFFEDMATQYGGYPNIMYEICNEPEGVSWADVKNYANTVIPAIRAIDPDNLIIVGTQDWSQRIDLAAADPLTGYTNIMYALHFYAGEHFSWVQERGNNALSSGLPIFVSEWGGSDYSGGDNGLFFQNESEILVDWMNDNNISWMNWSFSNKDETSAAVKPGVRLLGPWADQDLTQSGIMVKGMIKD